MQRLHLRRVLIVAVLALLGGTALVGCSQQPGTAATIGGTRITDDQIESMLSTLQADVDKLGANFKLPKGDYRVILTQFAVFGELAKQYAAEKGITVPAPDYAGTAAQDQLPESDPLVRLSAESNAYLSALLAKAPAVQPSDQDLRDIYDRVVAAGAQVDPFEQVKSNIAQIQGLPASLGLRAELTAAASRYGVSVNPRYQPLELPLQGLQISQNQTLPIVTVPVGSAHGSPAVRDL